ncbi:type II secretion system protein GspM [Allorhizobium undicola]|uniref:type II secretion system protein GspM n=1 Tax=Allorhizobium undicola TaxID=78527 RepID=UPI0013781BFD|nr:type II secretion system protein GspM [Allorhizobium undicola]
MALVLSLDIRQRRLILLGCGLVLTMCALFVVFDAVENGISGLSKIEDARRRLGLYEAIIASAEQLKLSPTPLADQISGFVFRGETDEIIRAEINGVVKAVAARHNLQINTINDIPSKALPNVKLVGLRVNAYGSFEPIQSVLLELEQTTPPLFIGALTLGSGFTPGATGGDLNINITLDLFGAANAGPAGDR